MVSQKIPGRIQQVVEVEERRGALVVSPLRHQTVDRSRDAGEYFAGRRGDERFIRGVTTLVAIGGGSPCTLAISFRRSGGRCSGGPLAFGLELAWPSIAGEARRGFCQLENADQARGRRGVGSDVAYGERACNV